MYALAVDFGEKRWWWLSEGKVAKVVRGAGFGVAEIAEASLVLEVPVPHGVVPPERPVADADSSYSPFLVDTVTASDIAVAVAGVGKFELVTFAAGCTEQGEQGAALRFASA